MNTRNSAQIFVFVLVLLAGQSCKTFGQLVYTYGGRFDLPIPADSDDTEGWMTDAVIDIRDHLMISDIDVGIDLRHTKVFDLQIFLQSPAGARLCLNSYNIDEYFEGQSYTQTIFDDEAEVPIEQAVVPFTGRFKPEEGSRLEIFDGEDAFGLWRLQIYDAFSADTGNLERFELIITIPEPATVMLFAAGISAVWLSKRRYD